MGTPSPEGGVKWFGTGAGRPYHGSQFFFTTQSITRITAMAATAAAMATMIVVVWLLLACYWST